MSRHRNVRSLNYEEECEHDDDIYGHSYDDHDYGMSPGTAQYMYDRNKHQQIFSFGSPSGDISHKIDEEPEEDIDSDGGAIGDGHFDLHDSSSQTSLIRQKLNDIDNAKLNSCLEMMRNILGENFAESTMMNAVIDSGYDVDQSINRLLSRTDVPEPKPQRKPRERKPRSAQDNTATAAVENRAKTNGEIPAKTLTEPATSSKPQFKIGADDESESLSSTSQSAQSSEQGCSLAQLPDSSKLSTPKREPRDFAELTPSSSSSQIHKSGSKAKFERLDAQKEYDKRRSTGKECINLVVIGHVDAGKSTLMGHLLYQLGFVGKKAMHKFEQDSRKAGKGSFAYAWVLDETEEERSRGVTMDIAQTRFEMPTKIVTLLDAPGHKDFIPNMITGAAQADVAILVVNATNGEFESGFDAGGQTREHTMLARSLGVSQLLVAVNKMDTVNWSKDRYDEIIQKLRTFFRQTGFKDGDVSFVPCSGLVGDNLSQSPPADHPLRSWYSGPTLATQIDEFRPPLRPVVDRPLRMCLTDVFKPMGAGIAVAGVVQTGNVQVGDRVLVVPSGELAAVKGISVDDTSSAIAFAGDNIVLTLTGIDVTNLSIGSIVCDPACPVETANRFRARVVIFNINFPITKGFPVVLHYQSLTEQAHIRHLVSQLNKNTGEVTKKRPRCLVRNSSAVVEIAVDRPICLELYSNCKDLGRFMLRSAGSTIAAGLVTEILNSKTQQDSSSAAV